MLILSVVPPPSAATLHRSDARVPPPSVVVAESPGDAVTHILENGVKIAIVPEEPIVRTVDVKTTTMIPSCGMNWCGSHPLVPHVTTTKRTICDNAPTPLKEIESILKQSGVTKDDVLADLGCGDGRVVITAMKSIGCRVFGLENRGEAIQIARANCRRNGLDDVDLIRRSTLDWQDYRAATVVFVYLEPTVIGKLEIPSTVRMGISYEYPWPGVRCEKIGKFYVWKRPELKRNADKLETASWRPPVRICAGGS